MLLRHFRTTVDEGRDYISLAEYLADCRLLQETNLSSDAV